MHFRFIEDLSRVIGVAKADVAAREIAANDMAAQPAVNANQAVNADVQPANNQQDLANVEPNQIPLPGEEPINRVEIHDGDQQILMEVFEGNQDEHPNEDDFHEHVEAGFHERVEDDYDEDEPAFNDNLPTDSSSSSESNDNDDADRTNAMEDQVEQNALNQLNEDVANAEAGRANLARSLEQLNSGLNEIDLTLRRHQDAIRTVRILYDF